MRWNEALGLGAALLGLASLTAAFVVAAAAPVGRDAARMGDAVLLVQR